MRPDRPFVPTVTQLRVFLAIADGRRFREAAAQLGMSQSAVSQAFSTLEEGLGVPLVERTPRAAELTAAGRRLVPTARAALAGMEAFGHAVRGEGGTGGGALAIGLIPTSAPYLVSGLLSALARTMPDVVPRIVEDQTARLVDGLRTGALDAAVLAAPTSAAGVAETELYREPLDLVVPAGHRFAGRTDLAAGELDEVELILLDEGHCLRDQVVELCREASVPVLGRTDSRVSSLATAIRCVGGGLGATLVPRSALAADPPRGDVAVARFAEPAPARTMALVTRAARRDEARLALLADAVRAAAAEAGAAA